MKLLALSTDEGTVRLHTERLLAHGRLALVLGGLVAVYFDPAEPAHFAPVAYTALGIYLVVSVGIAIVLHSRAAVHPRTPALLFTLDVVFASVLTSFTEGAGSAYFVFVWFAMTAAAFRSGMRGTFTTAAVVFAVIVGQLLLFPSVYQGVSLNVVIVRATCLAVMAFLLGYLAQKERDLRAEASAVARILARSRTERTFSAGLEVAIDEIARLYKASGAVLAITGAAGDRHCWMFTRTPTGEQATGELIPVTDAEEQAFFCDMPSEARTWFCRRDDGSDGVALDGEGNRARIGFSPPAVFWSAIGAEAALGATRSFGDWHVRLYLPRPAARQSSALMVHLLHMIAEQVGPALVNMYLLRMQAGTSERARLARELHDRVVQSLIGLELQVASLKRHDASRGELREHLAAMHGMLRAEIDNVRDLMHELRPVRVSPEDLPLYLADVVERFQRQTGIDATLTWDAASFTLTSRQCGGIARIVQEALVNARKHSGARAVAVRLGGDGDRLTLTIRDDGRGFPFTGRLRDDQLWTEHKGPLVIKERARSIGASLAIASAPGQGATLELVIPDAR